MEKNDLSEMKFSSTKLRLFVSGALLTATLVSGCGSSNDDFATTTGQVATGAQVPPPNERIDFPGVEVIGEAGDSTVYQYSGGMVVVHEVETERFLERFGEALPVPGARIIFPDASELVTDANGDFDASLSSYASSGATQDQRFGAEVTIVPPARLGLEPTETDIVVPTPAEDATLEVVLIPEDAVLEEPPVPGPTPDMVRAQGYVWSQNPTDYLAARLWIRQAVWRSEQAEKPFTLTSSGGKITKHFQYGDSPTYWFTGQASYAGTNVPVPGLSVDVVGYIYNGSSSQSYSHWTVSVWRGNQESRGLAAVWVVPQSYNGLDPYLPLMLVQF